MFGALAMPSGGTAHTGVVISPPFGEEMVNTYNRLSRWSKQLALEGFAVLRYHPYGTGESDGGFADFTLEGAGRDLVTATDEMRRRTGLPRIGVLGMRFGGTVAAHAPWTTRPDFLALWSPLVDLQQYFRELLRFKLTTEMVQQKAGGGARATLKGMSAELAEGRTVDVVDYELSPALYKQMTAITAWPDEPPASRVLVLARPMEDGEDAPQIATWRGKGADVTAAVRKVPVFWEDFTGGMPPEFTETTKAWMRAPGGSAR